MKIALRPILLLLALACLAIVLTRRRMRRRTWISATAMLLLIALEALLGGILVKSGTSTHWLFFHLSMATVILCTMVWSSLQALGVARAGGGEHGPLRRLIALSMGVVLVQIILGALVAGSRHNAPGIVVTWPAMHGKLVPELLWNDGLSLVQNLLDNTMLHQWVHRWFAVLVATVLFFVWLL